VIQEKTRLPTNQSSAQTIMVRAARIRAPFVRARPTRQRARREAGDQPAHAALIEAVDVLGDMGQQRADERIGRESSS
jgi:hypothetical protein